LARSVLQSETPTTITFASAANVLITCGVPPEETLMAADRAIGLSQQSDREIWYAQVQRAESLNLLGRAEEALEAGESALESTMNPSTVLAVLRSLQALERSEDAIQLAETAISKFPDDIEIKTFYAHLLNKFGRDKDCVELVESMGDKAVCTITPWLDMGDSLVRLKRYEEAMICYRATRKNLEQLKDKGTLEEYYIRAVAGEVNTIVQQGDKRQALRILDSHPEDYLRRRQEINYTTTSFLA